jgi:hypothetical protein
VRRGSGRCNGLELDVTREGRINGECQDQKFDNVPTDASDVFPFQTVLHKGLVISVI